MNFSEGVAFKLLIFWWFFYVCRFRFEKLMNENLWLLLCIPSPGLEPGFPGKFPSRNFPGSRNFNGISRTGLKTLFNYTIGINFIIKMNSEIAKKFLIDRKSLELISVTNQYFISKFFAFFFVPLSFFLLILTKIFKKIEEE